MPAELMTLTVIAAVVAGMGLIVYFLPSIIDPDGTPESSVPAGEILHRVASEDTCHHAPEIGYTVDDAHAMMRERLDCTIDRCAAKRMAYTTLVESGRIVPASERHVR
ncbi:hypothetical protein [Nocardia sp. NPDC052112]|uniref:hypothetical protein n=1 Tax=Nocardia sp. NPDC052112 TaxID=3155646 RepID=UPI0034335541